MSDDRSHNRSFKWGPIHILAVGFLFLAVVWGYEIVTTLPISYAESGESKKQDANKNKKQSVNPAPDVQFQELLFENNQAEDHQKTKSQSQQVTKGKKDKAIQPSDNKQGCYRKPLIEDIIKQKKDLAFKKQELERQKANLQAVRQRVQEQIAKLQQVRNNLVEKAQLAEAQADREKRRLVSIYEKMKPKQAAGIFNEMDPSVAAGLLRLMREGQSSEIMANMNPKHAYNVTLALSHQVQQQEEKRKSP